MRIAMGALLAVILAMAACLLFFAKPTRVASNAPANSEPSSPNPASASPPLQPQTPPSQPTPSQPTPDQTNPDQPTPNQISTQPEPAPNPAVDSVPPSPAPNPTPAPATQPTTESQWTAVEQRVFELTNVERVKAGLHPLRREDELHDSARAQSADMIARHFFDHTNPSGESPSDRIGRIARRLIGTAGENLWTGTGASFASNPDLANVIVQAWMHSPHHRENILRPDFTHLGVGVVLEGNEVRATQNFSEVKSHLKMALAPVASAGASIVFSTSDREPVPRMFDLQTASKGQPSARPIPIENAHLPSAPGNYRLRFYFPEGKGGYSIYDGPQIAIR